MENNPAHPFFNAGSCNLWCIRQGDKADLEVSQPLRRNRHGIAAVKSEEPFAFGKEVILSGRQGESKDSVFGGGCTISCFSGLVGRARRPGRDFNVADSLTVQRNFPGKSGQRLIDRW